MPGMFAQAASAARDLFRHDHVVIIDENGNAVEKVLKPERLANPITLLRMLSWKAWLFYLVGFLAWTVDGYDFHSVSLSVTSLAAFYGVSKGAVTTSITLTLLFRFIIGALQIGTIYAQNYKQFLAVRALFGIGMGGIWGGAVAMALESVPVEARGLLSGFLQQGYSLGYMLAAGFTLAFASEGTAKDSYKTLFWIGAGTSFAVGLIRMCFPESEQFIQAKKEGNRGAHTKRFFSEIGTVLRTQWKMTIYSVILMALFNLFSHTTQDAYPTFLISGKGLTKADSARGAIIAKAGALVGGTFIGYVSQSFGRRRSIVVSCICAAAIIPAWVLPNSKAGLAAGSFFLQFFVQGAWGVVPVHLNELSPPAFRASFPGLAYQLGNAISSPAAEIVTEISERHHIMVKGKRREAFGPTMGIATAIISVSLAIWTAVGKEQRGSHFEAGGVAGVNAIVARNATSARTREEGLGSIEDAKVSGEKESVDGKERVAA